MHVCVFSPYIKPAGNAGEKNLFGWLIHGVFLIALASMNIGAALNSARGNLRTIPVYVYKPQYPDTMFNYAYSTKLCLK